MIITENFFLISKKGRLLSIVNRGFEKFCDMSIKLLNTHTPIKKKCKHGNQVPIVTKDISKTIMKRSKLRSNYLKNKTDGNRMPYKKQKTTVYSF